MTISRKEILHTDILIIGGGTAGCYAALTIAENSSHSVIIVEKANIKRSGWVDFETYRHIAFLDEVWSYSI